LVTGATGNVGRPVVEHARRLGVEVRAGVRDPDTVRRSFGDDVDLVPFDFEAPDTFRPALDGIRGLFLLRPSAISNVDGTLNLLIDQAEEADVAHVVFLSVAGGDRAKFIPHAKVEAHLRRSGIAWTFLRAGFFAQNLGDAYRRDIVEDDRILLPAGRAAACFVDVRDVAEVAARALVEGTLFGEAPELVGPEALDFEQVAAILSDVLGRTIRYESVSVPRYLLHLRRQDSPLVRSLVQTVLHVGLRFGQGVGDATTIERLLGRRPGALRRYVEEHRELWRRGSGGASRDR
jgi:uncharacterized protein YbjT (DUF2867 family)